MLHPSITAERIVEILEESCTTLSSPGICRACGEDADGVEPDVEDMRCESCGEYQVTGAEQFIFELDL